MTTMNIQLPDSLYKQAAELAKKENISLEQLVSSALAEKVSAWMTQAYLEQRAARGARQKFRQAMDKVPDVDPDAPDRMD